MGVPGLYICFCSHPQVQAPAATRAPPAAPAHPAPRSRRLSRPAVAAVPAPARLAFTRRSVHCDPVHCAPCVRYPLCLGGEAGVLAFISRILTVFERYNSGVHAPAAGRGVHRDTVHRAPCAGYLVCLGRAPGGWGWLL